MYKIINFLHFGKRNVNDSPTAQGMQRRRLKAGYVMKGIAQVSHSSLIIKLSSNKFLLIVDETTDITTFKNCAIVCNFFFIDPSTSFVNIC